MHIPSAKRFQQRANKQPVRTCRTRTAGALDIAVVRIVRPLPDLQPVTLSALPPRPGDPCFVAGHALFNPDSGIRPLLTRGCVAQVLELPDVDTVRPRPAMLLTTAAVHSGASGGAVLDESGRLLGLVTSNARHASGGNIARKCCAGSVVAITMGWLVCVCVLQTKRCSKAQSVSCFATTASQGRRCRTSTSALPLPGCSRCGNIYSAAR